jgi:predicted TIM-barrel fold metal-dependent hydrolase
VVAEVDVVVPPIISVDDHLVEPPDLFERWLPAKHRDSAPKVCKLPWEFVPSGEPNLNRQDFRPASADCGRPEADCWIFGDVQQFIGNQIAAIGIDREMVDGLPVNFADMKPAIYDPKARLADMDAVNVERSLCYPNSSRFCGQVYLWMAAKDPELALACIRAYNDWAVEEWGGDSGGRLMPVGLIPLWDSQLAAEEVRRNAARGVRLVAFSELPTRLGLPSIHDRDGYWLPFIEACDETSTVIGIHIGSSSMHISSSEDAPRAVKMSHSNHNAPLSVADWLLSGLLARYPNIKLSFSESQIGWIPYVYERIDKIWLKGSVYSEIDPHIKELPSSYAKRRVYGCFFDDDFGIRSRHVIGVEEITYEGDYPHQDCLWPDTYTYLESVVSGLPQDEVHKVARGNALEMLGLPDHELIELREPDRPFQRSGSVKLAL